MGEVVPSPELPELTRAIGHQYDLFQTSLESLDKEQKFLNYGYTLSRGDSYEQRQERLCLEVFDAARIQENDVIVDVGFGSAEQDFLLHRTRPFAKLDGFNIAEKQVHFANRRAEDTQLAHKLSFHLGEAEALPGVPAGSVDKLLAIECAFYFDRPRFYRRVAEVLKPGGRAILADISLSDRLVFLTRNRVDFGRVGTQKRNRADWERYLVTKSVRSINRWTWPGAQMTVSKILRFLPNSALGGAERREWLSMAFYSELVALGLLTNLVHYDLIVLEKSA
jgi:ubiquinone/menaquinone biosynthesis C-methylase UbiE